jgi:hypothetical protein
MKHKTLITALSVFFVLIIAALWAGNTYAATGCFPDTSGHWAETFICWMKDNGVTSGYADGTYRPENNVTRAEMAIFLQKIFNLADSSAQARANTAETNAKNYADSLVNVPPSTGNILLNIGFSNWSAFQSIDPVTYSYFATGAFFRRTSAGTTSFVLHPDIPVVLYGKSLSLIGVELCYQTAAGNVLTWVRLRTYNHASSVSSASVLRFSDTTERNDNACRYYMLPTPIVTTPEFGVGLGVDVYWSVANTNFAFGRTTFVFQPTDIAAANVNNLPPSGLTPDDIVILQDNSSEPDTSPEAMP